MKLTLNSNWLIHWECWKWLDGSSVRGNMGDIFDHRAVLNRKALNHNRKALNHNMTSLNWYILSQPPCIWEIPHDLENGLEKTIINTIYNANTFSIWLSLNGFIVENGRILSKATFIKCCLSRSRDLTQTCYSELSLQTSLHKLVKITKIQVSLENFFAKWKLQTEEQKRSNQQFPSWSPVFAFKSLTLSAMNCERIDLPHIYELNG